MSGICRRNTAQRAEARNPGHQREKTRAIKSQPSHALGSLSRTHSRASSQKTRPPAQAARYVFEARPPQGRQPEKGHKRDPGQPAPLRPEETRSRGEIPEAIPATMRWRATRSPRPAVSIRVRLLVRRGNRSHVGTSDSWGGSRQFHRARNRDRRRRRWRNRRPRLRPQIGRSRATAGFRSMAGPRIGLRVDNPGREERGAIAAMGKSAREPRSQPSRCAVRGLPARTGKAGLTKSRKPTSPLTGLPGSPNTSAAGRSPRGGPIPNQSGLPGLRRTL